MTTTRIIAYKGSFLCRTAEGVVPFSVLTGRFRGINTVTERGESICEFNFLQCDGEGVLKIRIFKRSSLSLLMPLSTWSGRDTVLTLRAWRNGSDWTSFDVSTPGEVICWPEREIPPAGTFREIFIDNLIYTINRRFLEVNGITGNDAN